MADRLLFDRDGVRLACLDFGGAGSTVLLLHGLAGHAGEWFETASWLTGTHRVVALDVRGHGESEHHPADVSSSAQVADVAFVIEQLASGPVVLVGQSLGGVTALMVAARHPNLVRSLVLADAFPSDGGDGGAAAQSIGEALRGWPVPFASKEAATTFFRDLFGSDLCGQAWADGLAQVVDGWRPRFDIDVMVETLREALNHSTWADWGDVRCPVLVVRPGHGLLSRDNARRMLARVPNAQLVEIPEAQHDVHLDRPAEWRAVLSDFLAALAE